MPPEEPQSLPAQNRDLGQNVNSNLKMTSDMQAGQDSSALGGQIRLLLAVDYSLAPATAPTGSGRRVSTSGGISIGTGNAFAVVNTSPEDG